MSIMIAGKIRDIADYSDEEVLSYSYTLGMIEAPTEDYTPAPVHPDEDEDPREFGYDRDAEYDDLYEADRAADRYESAMGW